MTQAAMEQATDPRDLVLSLTLAAPREKIWRCWTESALLKQWFVPAPWTIASVDMDMRVGGRFNTVMRSPDGEDMPNLGVFLDIFPPERLVVTDAYTEGWRPAEKPFMTAIVTLVDNGDGTTGYTALARHWTEEDRKAHAEMGFEPGWTQCARQLEALARTL